MVRVLWLGCLVTVVWPRDSPSSEESSLSG